ncbi:MAG: response regulator [Thermoleophilia bacterium]
MERPGILVVEDSDADAELITLALDRSVLVTQVTRARTPREALVGLTADGAAVPSLMLVDVGLPGGGGVQLVRDVRRLKGAGELPIVMLSSSAQRADLTEAYAAGCNAYIVKPLRFADLAARLDATVGFWLTHNRTHTHA